MAKTIFRGKIRGKKRLTIALAAVLAIAGVGTAFAFWSSTGHGAGSATTGVSTAFTIAADPEDTTGTIAPGSDGRTVGFTVTNPGDGTQNLALVTVSLATADGTPWAPTGGCLAADYTATITTAPAYGEIIASGTATGVATVTLADTAANQDACQGQTVPLYFQAS